MGGELQGRGSPELLRSRDCERGGGTGEAGLSPFSPLATEDRRGIAQPAKLAMLGRVRQGPVWEDACGLGVVGVCGRWRGRNIPVHSHPFPPCTHLSGVGTKCPATPCYLPNPVRWEAPPLPSNLVLLQCMCAGTTPSQAAMQFA